MEILWNFLTAGHLVHSRPCPPCRVFSHSILAGIAPCTVGVPKISNIRTKQSLASIASIASFITENNCIVQNLKDSWNPQAPFYVLPFLGTWDHGSERDLLSDLLSSRSSTDEDCRMVLLFIPYRPRVIHALSWGERRLHYEWHSARYKHSCMLTWFHWPPNKLLSGALISSYLPQTYCIFYVRSLNR